MDDIVFISDPMKLKKTFLEIYESSVVGLDSEWRNDTALFQISTPTKTYLIDMLKPKVSDFNEKLLALMVDEFLCGLFANENIIKVSWDFAGDVHKLIKRFSNIKKKKFTTIKSFVDLLHYKDNSVRNGFSHFCKLHLGKELNKQHQCSDWELRPLAEEQIIYAAMDSKAAVRLYEKLKDTLAIRPKEFQIKKKDNLRNCYDHVREMIKESK
jgi:ribonuclease D